MSALRAGLVVAATGGLVAALLALYLDQREEAGREVEREAPIVAPSRVRSEAGGPVVVIDSAEARRMGLETAVLAVASSAPPRRLPAQVVEEPERVAAVRAPLAGLLSAPASARWPAIGDRLEAGAEIAQVSDARPLAVPLGGTVTRIGARPGEIVAAGQLILEVVDRSRPAVRVVWDPEAGAPPVTLVLEPPGGARRVTARRIGPAPEADALTRRPAFLYRAEHDWPGAAPGTPVSALARSGAPAARGALVPDAAVVQWDGLAWAYRQRGKGTYERVAVSTDRPVAGGWIATRGLSGGDTIVVTGAQELISEEFRARVTVGDESGE
jgi:biotin carboxyl carrier protein